MTGDNAEPLEGWTLPARHCGTWCERECGVCGMDAILHPQDRLPEGIILGEN